jgi:hypothetical protein
MNQARRRYAVSLVGGHRKRKIKSPKKSQNNALITMEKATQHTREHDKFMHGNIP